MTHAPSLEGLTLIEAYERGFRAGTDLGMRVGREQLLDQLDEMRAARTPVPAPEPDDGLSGMAARRLRVIVALRDAPGPMTTREIAAALGDPPVWVRRTLLDLESVGVVMRAGWGELTKGGRPPQLWTLSPEADV